ncbi:MAG TPA: ribosome-associated translation inhibitor RaiA [Micromonospora sp.]|nr:ribosome-associated translation inhibitor RaiA [Micromonospora sp.]
MNIVVKGRNVEVPDHYRIHVAEKLAKVKRYDNKLMRIEVELFHERNPRQADHCQRVEITCISRGPVVRAVARAKDFYSALDGAITKLDARLRRAADRRRVHPGRPPVSVAAATANLPVAELGGVAVATLTAPPESAPQGDSRSGADGYDYDSLPGRIVRRKEHSSDPMTVDDALFQMELVGHDFFLFQDKESGRPSVVYRRKGYDYGVISLAA